MTIERFTEYPQPPADVLAVRYQAGQPLDELRRLAGHENAYTKLEEVPEFGVVIHVRGDHARYLVIPDGSWLVYWLAQRRLTVRSDEDFRAEFTPKQPGLVEAVASTIGLHMVCRESTTQIAEAALRTADDWRKQNDAATAEPPF